MAVEEYYFTSESLAEGQVDKVCDQISDAILDAYLVEDPLCRLGCETLVKTGMVFLAGEIASTTRVNLSEVAREVLRGIGYTDLAGGLDPSTCAIITSVEHQSPDIGLTSSNSGEIAREMGASAYRVTVGYACTETPELMPLPITLAHKLTMRLSLLRRQASPGFLRPDGVAQVTVEYRDGRPVRIADVAVSTQHTPDVGYVELRETIIDGVIRAVIPAEYLDNNTVYHVNPTGRFVVGGAANDVGLTGRKIMADTYGGMARHGGHAFSGKDPSKIERSASYMMRHIAKNIVAAGLAERCEVIAAYGLGVADPVSLKVDTFGTGRVPNSKLLEIVRRHFYLTPRRIVKYLNLCRPIYKKTATFGHFGRNESEFTWERIDRVKDLREHAGV